MDSREILSETETLRYILDTPSLDSDVSSHSPLGRLLHFKWHEDFDFYRTPGESHSSQLNAIRSLEIDRNPEKNNLRITWGDNTLKTRYYPDKHNDLAKRGDYISPKPQKKDVALVEIFDALTNTGKDYDQDILLTENRAIISNRRRLEYEFRRHDQKRLHIMKPREAVEFTGILSRSNNEFIFHPPADNERAETFRIDRPLWCWCISRLILQHLKGGNSEYLGSLFDRFEGLIIGIDELGEQHYRGTGNHTDILVRYHFNNCVSILTGIGDVLALYTQDRYDIDLEEDRTTIRTGRPLFKELRDENETLWQHIHSKHSFIEILHLIRNDIIHQSGVMSSGPGFTLKDAENTVPWKSHVISLNNLSKGDREAFRKYYDGMNDSVLAADPMTEWGIITTENESPKIGRHTHIASYQFVKKATSVMAEFVDEYLRLLGFSNQVKNLSDGGVLQRSTVETVAGKGLYPLIDDLDPSDLPGPKENQN